MNVILVLSDKFLTQFMQAADVFESFKVVIKDPVIATVEDDFGPANIEAIKAKCDAGKYGLVACIGFDKIHYSDIAVKVVSTGGNWATLDDYIGWIQREFMLINDKESHWHVGAVS